MSRYDLVIFDLDGTLADTKRDIAGATNHTLRALGLPEHDVDTVAGFVGGGLMLLLRRALGSSAEDPALLERAAEVFRPYYREHLTDATRPYPGTKEMLDALRGAGVRMAIATNKPRMFTAPLVERVFPGLFDPVIACGASPDDDAPRKPDPACVARCRAAHPSIPAGRILFVGDSVVDIETGRNAGLDVAAVVWGYGARPDLESRAPRWLVDDNVTLAQVILGRG